jgi:arginyl-tRNA synthetase
MPFYELKQSLVAEVGALFPEETLEFSYPPDTTLGHLALPCFQMGKKLKTAPGKIAADLAQKFTRPGLSAKAAGPYVNFRWNPSDLYVKTLTKIFAEGDRYGSDTLGAGKTIVLEYCSPNIAKKLYFQHIRSTLIGNVLANIYDFLGFQTERINFVGDWGTQFARLLTAYELWGDPAKLQQGSAGMDHLLELYVRFHKEVETKPELAELSSETLKRLESHEATATEKWKSIREISIQAMNYTLKRMNAVFNHVEGESTYIPAIEMTLKEIKAKAGGKISEGAYIIEVPDISTPALIQKKDGTTLYLTRDIAAAIDRYQRFKFEKSLYMVSEQQKLHFQQLFGVLKMAGHQWADRCEHISFGTVLYGSEKMSTREGRVILLDDILEEAKKLALEECVQKNPSLADKETVAEQVGIGAIIFGQLSSHRTRDIEFDWKRILAFDGETGPYVQYSCVRCESLLDKAKEKNELPGNVGPLTYEFSPEEESLILLLAQFRCRLIDAVESNEPYHLTHYLIDVAKSFNRFYYRHPVLQASDASLKALRLNLVKATQIVLKNGLNLLGIACPREM